MSMPTRVLVGPIGLGEPIHDQLRFTQGAAMETITELASDYLLAMKAADDARAVLHATQEELEKTRGALVDALQSAHHPVTIALDDKCVIVEMNSTVRVTQRVR